MNDDLAAHPIDVVAMAQRRRHRCQRVWVHLLTVVFIGADVAVLAEGTSHVWRSDILLSHFVIDIFRTCSNVLGTA